MASTDSSRSNLGPLTTAFTYPAGCDVAVHESSGATIAYQAQTCSDNPDSPGGEQDNPDCWPQRAYGNLVGGVAFLGWGFYSPGLECPDGYVTACSATGADGWQFQFPLLDAIPLTYIETSSGESITGVSELRSVAIYAPLFQLVHRPSDVPSTPAETTSEADVRTASSELDNGASASSGSPNGGLPTGAQAGIGIGEERGACACRDEDADNAG
ncbi:hypothetical protein DL768_008434 [Monosporascus sp. mg162]|nr:hypothetical protein DL768_008434 [Monosporascus sp. mg162]